MGPPTNVDGEVGAESSTAFAIVELQWGRRQTSTERRRGRIASAVIGGGFNGAADKRRRRDPSIAPSTAIRTAASMGPPTNVDGENQQPNHLTQERYASMGPPTNVDGETALSLSRRARGYGFNGAADKRRRRAFAAYGLGADNQELQWGRRQTSTEREHPAP